MTAKRSYMLAKLFNTCFPFVRCCAGCGATRIRREENAHHPDTAFANWIRCIETRSDSCIGPQELPLVRFMFTCLPAVLTWEASQVDMSYVLGAKGFCWHPRHRCSHDDAGGKIPNLSAHRSAAAGIISCSVDYTMLQQCTSTNLL